MFLGQIWSQKPKFSKLTEIWYLGTLLYPYFEFMLILSKFLWFKFFWLIWSHYVKFYKMTAISNKGTLLYAYYDFSVYFFKNFVSHSFLDKFHLKIWSFPNWLKFRSGVHCYLLITILTFIFFKILSFIWFGEIWSQNLMFSKLTEIWYKGNLLYADYGFDM